MSNAAIAQTPSINGFEPTAMQALVDIVTRDPKQAVTTFRVRSEWKGGARSEAHVDGYELGGQKIARKHVIKSDEPREFFGEDSAPNPQDLLLAALNACMLYGYASGASMMGIVLDSASIESEGTLDVRRAMGLTEEVPAGFPTIKYRVRLRARNATREQLEELHKAVMNGSPNRYHLASPIPLVATLDVG